MKRAWRELNEPSADPRRDAIVITGSVLAGALACGAGLWALRRYGLGAAVPARREPPKKEQAAAPLSLPVALIWMGPVNLQQVAGAVLPGVPTKNLTCTGNGSPSCGQIADGWRGTDGRRLPGLRRALGLPEGRIVVAGFSAGGHAAKRLLEHPADRAEVAGVYLADATYTTDVVNGKPAPIKPFVDYAREVIGGADRFMLATASATPNPSTERPGVVYPSAAATLEAIRRAVAPDAAWKTEPVAGAAAWRSGRVAFLDFGTAFAHAAHATELAPRVWAELVLPLFAGAKA